MWRLDGADVGEAAPFVVLDECGVSSLGVEAEEGAPGSASNGGGIIQEQASEAMAGGPPDDDHAVKAERLLERRPLGSINAGRREGLVTGRGARHPARCAVSTTCSERSAPTR